MNLENFEIDMTGDRPSIEHQLEKTELDYSQCAVKGYDYYLKALGDLLEANLITSAQYGEAFNRLTVSLRKHLIEFSNRLKPTEVPGV